MKKVLIVHYRVGRTDGVSLEIEKRKKVLEDLGYEVLLLSGPIQKNADYIVPELEFSQPTIFKINNNCFFKLKNFSEKRLAEEIIFYSDLIKNKIKKIILKEKIDYLMVHNIFSHGRHLIAAKAFYELAKELHLKVVATHHDFYWERPAYQKPSCQYIKDYLAKYYLPSLPNVKHVVINSQLKKILRQKYEIKAEIIPDTFDFKQKKWQIDNFNKTFKKDVGIKASDLVALQATRVVERKGIELAIDLIAEINRLQKGKPRTILLLAGYAEKDSLDYLKKLKQYALTKKVILKNIAKRVDTGRKWKNEEKIYSLWDCYVFSDFVTYPSLYEGWGNQFIEAVFARKPIVVYQYPVFQSDILPEGYDIISLGKKNIQVSNNHFAKTSKKALNQAAKQIIKILNNKKMGKKIVNHNYNIGKKYHSFLILKKQLLKVLS